MSIQDDLIDHIETHVRTYGYPPSLRYLAKAMGLAVSTVHYHLDRAVEAGLIERVPGSPRAIRVVR